MVDRLKEPEIMKMDHELIKKILIAFEESETAYTKLDTIADKIEIEDKTFEEYIYNCELIADKELIVDENSNYEVGKKYADGGKRMPLRFGFRLTAEGHEYLSAIKKPAIWEKTKKIAGDAGLGTMIEAAKLVLSEAIKNAITG
jgi:hypothetical protein